jgi:hypothetical protein
MIGNLTNDMTRLCGEITALRDSRAQARDDLKDTVSQMLTDLRNAQAEMAAKTKTELHDFVGNVKQVVTALREEFREDLAGARRAWCGQSSLHTPSRMAAAEQPKEFASRGKKKKQ